MSGTPEKLGRIERALRSRRAGWILLLALAIFYGWIYWTHPLNPGSAPIGERVGWWSWSDQFRYLRATETLAEGRVTRETYHYPLGYSALGVPFVRWWPAHAYFVPDLLLVLGTGAVWWRLARRWLSATVTLAAAAGFILTHGELLRLTMVVPWNTLPTQLTLLAGVLALLETRGRRSVWWLASLAAVTWPVRPVDAICFTPMLGWAVMRLSDWRERIIGAAGGAAIVALAMTAVGALNLAVWDSWRTPYEQAAHTMVGFFSYPMAQKLYWTFIDARPFFGETDTALLWRYPWLFLAVPGLVFWVKRERGAGIAALGTLVLSWTLYLGYNDFFPSSFYRFSLIHYVSWSFLPLFAAAVAACWVGWRIRAVWAGWLGGLVLVMVMCGLRLEPQVLSAESGPGEVRELPRVRPLWVRYPGESLEKVASLRLDGRPMLEAADYQIPYVPSDLLLLLSDRATGTRLHAPSEAEVTVPPQVGDYRWGWRWEWFRGSR